MAIKPRKQLKERQDVEPWIVHLLLYGELLKESESDNKAFVFQFSYDRKIQQKIWNDIKAGVLKQFIKKNPCKRPLSWWKFDAPKEKVEGWDHERFDSPQRQRLGGIGTPSCEVTNSWSGFPYGIPSAFIDQWSVDYYNGRAKDIHGKSIGTNYKEGDFSGVAIDPNDPPLYESQAAYLERLGLLTPTEKAYLKKHQELMEPEAIEYDKD